MILASTLGSSPWVGFREAIRRGLAPDGGLYLPAQYPSLSADDLREWRDLPFPELAARLAIRLLGDEFDPEAIERETRSAFDFEVPTLEVKRGRFVLELFHGPTLAFKDFGARFLARFLARLLDEDRTEATILVATSGDTGSAVAQGFHEVPRVRIVVLYPAGKVSHFQEAQMATLGGNVDAVRVPGTFDDCQRLVKQAFLDPRLAGLRLTSANSINIGRLLPQAFYYVTGYLAAASEPGDPVVFSVPTGNLGNLSAGVIAQRLGLPVRRFVAATNSNTVLPDYLETGVFRPRPSVATLSNAMDVGDPNNFPRLLSLHDGSRARLRANVYAASIDDNATRRTIRDVHWQTGYVLDPHTAVGWAAADRYLADERDGAAAVPLITLATAHPAKFGEAIEQELGFGPELPADYRGWAARPLLASDLADARYESFREHLLRTAR